jgi:hypothetical protein
MYYATGLPFWARGYPEYHAGSIYDGPLYRGEYTPEKEMEALKTQTEFFQKQIDVLNERIRELEGLAAAKSDKA